MTGEGADEIDLVFAMGESAPLGIESSESVFSFGNWKS